MFALLVQLAVVADSAEVVEGLSAAFADEARPLRVLVECDTGAAGITCQKISETEAMIAEGGIDDVFLTYNVLGPAKLARLKALERENRELRQANEILRKASAYFAQAELDRRFKP